MASKVWTMLIDWLRNHWFVLGVVLQVTFVLVAIGAHQTHDISDFEVGMLFMLTAFTVGMLIFWMKIERYFRSLPEEECKDLIKRTIHFRIHIMLLTSGLLISVLLALFGLSLDSVFVIINYMGAPMIASIFQNKNLTITDFANSKEVEL